MHFSMHNILFLVRNEYNALTVKTPSLKTPDGYKATTEYCKLIQAARAVATAVPAPITAQDRAIAEIAEVMAEAKAKARLFYTRSSFLTLLTQRGYILKQRPRKIVKSKAVVEDKDDDEVEVVLRPTDTDYTMGGCDGLNASSGADTVRF